MYAIRSYYVQKLSGSVSTRGRVAKATLLVATTALLILALARPQFGTRVETIRSEGRDVMVALDVSASMLAEDVPPTRLDRARLEIARLIRGLDGDRVGLVAFAGNAFVRITSYNVCYTKLLRFSNSWKRSPCDA